jgi:uncharacterized protein YceH (UPF0502 family)
MSNASPLPLLSAEEIRILGCLMEKSRTTPELYPLTLSSLTQACNQKTSRNPVVSYSQATVGFTIEALRRKDLLTRVLGDGRVPKFRHNLAVNYPLLPPDIAVLALLFLRGPLTPGEIRTASARLYDFEDLAEVVATLDKLCQGETPYIRSIGKAAGQKEARFAHLFAPQDASAQPVTVSNHAPFTDRVADDDALTLQLDRIEARLASIEVALRQAGLLALTEMGPSTTGQSHESED